MVLIFCPVRIPDQMVIRFLLLKMENGYNLLSEVKKQNTYKVAIRYSGESSEGKLHLETENGNKSETIILAPTGDNNKWKTVVLSGVKMNAGTNKIKVVFEKGGFNLNYLGFFRR
jgi:endoglucanase